jgi:hypothetical protein
MMVRVRSTILEDEYCCISDKCNFSFVEYVYGQKANNSKSECSKSEEHKAGAVEPSQDKRTS